MPETNERDQRLGIQFDPSQGGRYLPTGQGTPTPTVSGPPQVLGLSGINPQPQGQQMIPQSAGMLQQFNQMAQQPLVGNINQSLASGVSGMGTAFAGGQGNPVLSQMMAERDQRLKTKLEQINLQMRVEAARSEQSDKLGKIAMDLVKMGGVPATLGAPMLRDYLKKNGYQMSPDLDKAFGVTLEMKDVKDILQAKEIAGLDLPTVQGMFKNRLSDAVVAEVFNRPMDDKVRKYIGVPTTAETQLAKLNADEKIGKIAASDLELEYPELDEKPLRKYLQDIAFSEYTKSYTALPQDERKKVLHAAVHQSDLEKARRAAAAGGAKFSGTPHLPQHGGVYYDRMAKKDLNALPSGDDLFVSAPDGNRRYVEVTPKEQDTIHLMNRGLLAADWLKEHMGEVLASVAQNPDAGKNIIAALKSQGKVVTGLGPTVDAFVANSKNLAFEDARIVGGTTAMRRYLAEILTKIAAPNLMDSQQQAMKKVDLTLANMWNMIGQIHGDPTRSLNDVRGPGQYWVKVQDPNSRNFGKTVPVTLPKGIWASDLQVEVMGPR